MQREDAEESPRRIAYSMYDAGELDAAIVKLVESIQSGMSQYGGTQFGYGMEAVLEYVLEFLKDMRAADIPERIKNETDS